MIESVSPGVIGAVISVLAVAEEVRGPDLRAIAIAGKSSGAVGVEPGWQPLTLVAAGRVRESVSEATPILDFKYYDE